MHRDGSVTVTDNGRGIPVGLHPEEKIPTVELVLTELHAGAKFSRTDADARLQVLRRPARRRRLGHQRALRAARSRGQARRRRAPDRVRRRRGDEEAEEGAAASARRTPAPRCASGPTRSTSTRPKVSLDDLERIVRSKAVLLPGVKVTLNIETAKETTKRTWNYPEGMKGYLAELLGEAQRGRAGLRRREVRQGRRGQRLRGRRGRRLGVRFRRGRQGLRRVLRQPHPHARRRHARGRAARRHLRGDQGVRRVPQPDAASGIKLLADDAWSRTVYFLSAKVLEPQFHGQTKEKLSNRDAVKLVAEMVRDPFELWMNSNVEYGRKIADLVIRQAIERSRSVQKVERKKSSSVVILPEKLTDCESSDLERQRAVPGRRRFGGRLGQAGARQALPGDLQHARQGAQLVGGEARAAVLQRRDPRHRGRARRRSARREGRARTSRACATARSPR